MNEQQVARGRRAVACPGWRWMPGMLGCLASTPQSTIRIVHAGAGLLHHPNGGVWSDDGVIPVLEDPATLGCLVALAREAWGCDEFRRLGVEPAGAGFCLILRNGRHHPPSRAQPGWNMDKVAHPLGGMPRPFGDNEFPSEPEAWLAALEAAGRR